MRLSGHLPLYSYGRGAVRCRHRAMPEWIATKIGVRRTDFSKGFVEPLREGLRGHALPMSRLWRRLQHSGSDRGHCRVRARNAFDKCSRLLDVANLRATSLPMCNDYEQHIRWGEYCEMMQALELGIPPQQTELDLPQADDFRINDLAPVMRAAGNQIELVQMNFSFPPAGKGGPVFNFRSEGRSFANSNRCLIPASAFFEFTGKKYPKAKHRFTLSNARFMAIAGIWREGQGNHPPAFTMLTTEPGPDVAPIHNRQIVVLQPSDWGAWIYLTKPEKELLRPLPEGSLNVETVRAGSD